MRPPLRNKTTTSERIRADEDRQALARKLEEGNAGLEEAQRVAHVGHWEWDLETNVIVWSDETYRIFGLTPQERPMGLATVRGAPGTFEDHVRDVETWGAAGQPCPN